MSPRPFALGLLLLTYTSAKLLFPASVTYLQPTLPSGAVINGVQADAAGNVYVLTSAVAGTTPATYVTKIPAVSTESGWSATVPTRSTAMVVGADGSVYITGVALLEVSSIGALQPTSNVQAAFLVKLTSSGDIAISTYICGEASCNPSQIAVDQYGNTFISGMLPGQSYGLSFMPTSSGVGVLNQDHFLVEIDPTGSKLLFAAEVGGSVMTVDAFDNVYFAFPGPYSILGDPSISGFQQVLGIDTQGVLFDAYLPDGDPTGIAAVSTSPPYDNMETVYLVGSPLANYPVEGTPIQTASMVLPSNGQNAPANCGNMLIGCTSAAPPLPSVPEPFGLNGTGYLSIISQGGIDLVYSTYFGGTGVSEIASVAVDQTNGFIDVTGYMTSSDIPGLDAGSSHCIPSIYVSQLKLDGSAVLQTTPVMPMNGLSSLASSLSQNGNIYINDGTAVAVVNPIAPTPPIACIASSADQIWTSTVAPGQLITVFGRNLANATVVGAPINGEWPTALPSSDVAVTFDGIPAPLLYVSPNQVNVQAPFEISGKAQTTIQLNRSGQLIDARTLSVVVSSPTIFQVPMGPGDCPNVYAGAMEILAINQNGSLNSCVHQATPGSTATFFVNGLGVTSLSNRTGAVISEAAVESGEAITLPPAGGYTLPVVTFGPVTSLAGSIEGVYSVQVTIDPSYSYDIITPLIFGGVGAVNGLDILSCGSSYCIYPQQPISGGLVRHAR